VKKLTEDAPTLVGIDHGFRSRCAISRCMGCCRTGRLLDDSRPLATDEDVYVDFVRDGIRATVLRAWVMLTGGA